MDQTGHGTLRTPEQLLAAGLIAESEVEKIERVASRFAVALTPQVHSLIDTDAAADPIAAQFVPQIEELHSSHDEREDPIGDRVHSPLAGIVHRYPDRVLLMPLHVCPVYCRFCFRREVVGPGSEALTDEALDKALDYIEAHPQIWEVIVTGGDPLVMSPRRARKVMERLARIEHVGVVRYHTRVPIVKPDAVTDELVAALRIDKAVYIVVHANHARELSPEAKRAFAKLIDGGLPMLSQTVLLRGVNADAKTLEGLFRALVANRVKPYYLHHADLARGTKHFRTSIAEGQQLMRELRGQVSGLCQPHYVLDIPGGHGKVPIGPNCVTATGEGQYTIEDYQGRHHPYEDSLSGA